MNKYSSEKFLKDMATDPYSTVKERELSTVCLIQLDTIKLYKTAVVLSFISGMLFASGLSSLLK